MVQKTSRGRNNDGRPAAERLKLSMKAFAADSQSGFNMGETAHFFDNDRYLCREFTGG